MSESSAAVSAWRYTLGVLGVGLMGMGAYLVVATVPTRQWPSALLWFAGGVAVHDVLLAPLAIVLGLALLPRVPVAWRSPLRGALLGWGIVALVGLAVLAGAAGRRDPSVVPRDPWAAIAAACAVVAVTTAAGWLVGRLTDRRRRRAADRGRD
ncbi:conserved hypothetical protein [Beutenbergia cavernae DSM 12333]|uniref:Uncharacterized protein n=1 Tax=Beutenbergia cavernae (strain ATCC BAA-8 / DSM 12333 / CCUG 43141 / JCM 11478 / NBRC 16432 / NCIMB 13614 / HKI 0122) TaxID=471853 RepID=C5C006_BEUC1|nr:hypothetical protein [Beutenbergia cavernae]ACQ81336.1 conserved hypothetical protein [Beutenbergia cavernae DSM 12333]